MKSVLWFCGIFTMIIALIVGIASGSFIGAIFGIIGGITSGIIFFALAFILENQEDIIYKLNKLEEINKKTRDKLTCNHCNHTYDDDYSSCPKCGHRENVRS